MTYVDPSSQLNQYLGQGGPSGGAGPAPQGGGGAMAWLQYIAQRFGVSLQQAAQIAQSGVVSPAQAGDVSQGGFPLDAVATLNAGGTPPVNNTINAAAINPPVRTPATAAPVPNSPLSTRFPTGLGAPTAPVGMPPLSQPPASAPVGAGLPDFTGMPRTNGVLSTAPNPNPPGYAGSTGATGGVPAGAVGGATGQGATANPRFVTIDRPNADPIRGPYGGAGGSLQMGAMQGNPFAGLFNRGQPAANVAAPGGSVSVTRPNVPGPLAQNVPLNQTPTPAIMPDDIRRLRMQQSTSQPNQGGGYT